MYLITGIPDDDSVYKYQSDKYKKIHTVLGGTSIRITGRRVEVASVQAVDTGIKVPQIMIAFQLPRSQQAWYQLLDNQFRNI